MELGNHIKEHRAARGLSQEDLAARIYVSRQTVSNWETDKTYPDVESLMLLSVLFETTIDELIKGDVEAMQKTVSNEFTKMMLLSWGGVAVVAVGTVALVAGVEAWGWNVAPSLIIAALLYAIGATMVFTGIHLQKKHDLYTYREILAYAKGEPIDRNNPKSQEARHNFTKRIVTAGAIGGIAGGIIGFAVFMLLLH